MEPGGRRSLEGVEPGGGGAWREVKPGRSRERRTHDKNILYKKCFLEILKDIFPSLVFHWHNVEGVKSPTQSAKRCPLTQPACISDSEVPLSGLF